jgi:hypothetical protein
MIEEQYIELINKEIDGELTTIEQEKLHSYLGSNPDAQNFYDELRQTANLLSQIPKVEPSPNIKKYVMNTIDLKRYSTAKKRIRFRSIFSRLFFKPIPKLVYAFALGILVGILVYSALLENVISKRGMDTKNFYGTIGVIEKSDLKTVKDIPIALHEINGTVSIKRYKNIVVLETDLHTLKETEIQLEYDNSHLQFSHFSSGSRAKISFDAGENFVRSFAAGDIRFVLFFTEVAADDKPIILKISIMGEVRFSQSISL